MAKQFIVTNTEARLIHIANMIVIPGRPTEIPPEYVEAVKKSVPFKARWLQEGAAVMPAPQVVAIEKLPVASALKLIAAETNVAMLSSWADSVKDPDVLKAIRDRVQNL